MKRLIMAILCVLAAAPVSAQTPSPTVQQQFEAGSAALAEADWARAEEIFRGLERRLISSNARSLAITRVRRATALLELSRLDDSAEALRLSLPNLPQDDASLYPDRYLGLVSLGRIAETRLDYPAALQHFRAAAAIPVDEIDRLSAYRGLVQTQLFDDPDAALRDANTALAIAQRPGSDREMTAQMHTLKGRALLNLGRHREAREELTTAMRLLGNLTLRVNYADLVARSDLALAALLSGDEENARRYLAYTGAGRFNHGYISTPRGNRLPPCGAGLSPDDVAVVQLWALPDGSVGYAMPIYASRRGPAALTFARAVQSWTFDPERLREIPSLLLAASRVEIRCTQHRGAQWNVGDMLGRALMDLAGTPGDPPLPPGRQTPEMLRAAVTALEARRDATPAQLVSALAALASHPLLETAERRTVYRDAFEIAARARMAPDLLAPLAFYASVREGTETEEDVEAAFALPEIQASPEAAAILRLLSAQTRYFKGEYDMAARIVNEARASAVVTGSPMLTAYSADLAALIEAVRTRGSRATSTATTVPGAGAPRCALVPRRQQSSGSASDYPNEALRWSFGGWAIVEHNVQPDGQATNGRVVTAYPPFVFGDAARSIGGRTRLEPGAGPTGAACVNREIVRFSIVP